MFKSNSSFRSSMLPVLVVSLFFCFGFRESVYAQNDGWNISTSQRDPYTGVVVANGRLGFLPTAEPFGIQQIIPNNVYDKESPLGVSRILAGINFGNLDLTIDGQSLENVGLANWQQVLHMKEAAFETRFTVPGKAEISYIWYALRNVPYAGYVDIKITPLSAIDIEVTAKIQTPEEYQDPTSTFRVLQDLETTMPILQTVATSRQGRHQVAASGTFIWHGINSTREEQRPELHHQLINDYDNRLSFEKKLKRGEVYEFAWTGALTTTQDFHDPQTESERFVIFNLLTPRQALLDQHKDLWSELWEGDIEIEGDLGSQQDVRLALYHLYSFARADSNLSIAPMGLSSQGYNGHIFWDTELWMYPPLLLLHQDIARSLVNYRSDRLEKARQKAVNFGYQGAMFPWESDDTGEEATPAWALTGTFEHHITADVAIAFWNYYRVTRDQQWLEERGYPMLQEVADYWVSRVTPNPDGSYSINNVVGANEFAPNVNDNAFTNGSAITALQYATLAAKAVGLSPNPAWEEVASKIRILQFPDGTTKEHATYTGAIIKQADVNLLTYPLNIVTDPQIVSQDLNYYEPKLAEEGPAMGQSIFAIIYARQGNAKEAFRLFKRSYEPNKRPPFGALAESALSDNPYFATGAGGMLQTVLFGFGGLHLTENGIEQQNPILPAGWKKLTLKGIGPENKTYVIE
ncbi:glycosyl hydrolase family 95 catalytic domain-containing protein [Croceiramulus getboli]|nr:glycoside hydrolase family 65 protein [Flavobacteriaceae bacterium YJPT1-3]